MKLTDSVAYLQGLMDGLEINESTKEGKVLVQMAEILQEMALSIDDIETEIDEVIELADTLDQDLGDLEEDFYELDDDFDDEDDEELDGDDEYYEVICPSCGDTICLNQEMIEEGAINCPGCKELLEFDFDSDDIED